MRNEQIEKLKSELSPLYDKLIKDVENEQPAEKAFFCMQWGKNFPNADNDGLMFVGRATNGWKDHDYKASSFFGNSFGQLFNLPDQMQWVEDAEGSSNYNTKSSAFWRVIKAVSSHFYPSNWSSYVAWSDVCKVAPFKGGNPLNSLYYAQIEDCEEIFKAEVKALSPKAVIFFTGYSWAKDILISLNGGNEPKPTDGKAWGGNYKAVVYKINGINYIVTEHPQGKSEVEHTDTLIKIIEGN